MLQFEGREYDREQHQAEMEVEAEDALVAEYEHGFTVEGKCIACLERRPISPLHLCEACDDQNESSGGALLALIKGSPAT